MDICLTHITLSILVWIPMLLNHVSTISIPTPSLDLDSSNANPLNLSDLDIPSSNLTSLAAIDPAFGFVPLFQGAKLRPVPCLLNSVNVALQLALEDFEGPMFATVFRLDSHPQVEVGVLPEEEGGSIPRKYAVWGLNVGIHIMLINHNFQTAVFILSYRGETVARITFKATGASISLSTPTTNTTQDLNHPPSISATTNPNTTSIRNPNPPNSGHLEISFRLTGSTITIYEIFLMALDMLRELAPFKLTCLLVDGVTRIPTANLDVATRETDPPRTAQKPPYFQVEWLMRAVARTPAYMLEQRSFREVELGLFVDEVKVGEVSIGRPRSGVGLGDAVGDGGTSVQMEA